MENNKNDEILYDSLYDFYNYVNDIQSDMYDDMRKEMKRYEAFIVIGTKSNWQGKGEGFEVYDNFDDIIQKVCVDCDQIKVSEIDNKYLEIEAYHHDGSVNANVYALTSEGNCFADAYFNVIDNIYNPWNSLYSKEDITKYKANILEEYNIDLDKELKEFNSKTILQLLRNHNMIEDIKAY